jgi:hypothetical protein
MAVPKGNSFSSAFAPFLTTNLLNFANYLIVIHHKSNEVSKNKINIASKPGLQYFTGAKDT